MHLSFIVANPAQQRRADQGSAGVSMVRCSVPTMQGAGAAEAADAALSKVVLARRSDVRFSGALDPLTVLATLQERDPRAYQFFLQVKAAMLLESLRTLIITPTGSKLLHSEIQLPQDGTAITSKTL